MIITSIDVIGSNDNLIATLSFRDPASQNPYIAKAVVGLDADEIVARFYGISHVSKSKYYSLSLEARDVILRIALNPQFAIQSYSELRDHLYKGIAASRTGKVELRFNNLDVPVAHVSGFIKKFEAPHSTETPEVQLTIECDDPMLQGFQLIEPIAQPTQLSTATITDDLSTAPHGFKFDITFTGPSPEFVLQDATDPEWTFTVTPGTIGAVTGFQTFDQVYFSSESGNKYLYLIRGGVTTHLVDKIKPDSIWPILFPGDNVFDSADEEFTWDHVSYYPAYWGV